MQTLQVQLQFELSAPAAFVPVLKLLLDNIYKFSSLVRSFSRKKNITFFIIHILLSFRKNFTILALFHLTATLGHSESHFGDMRNTEE